MGGCGQSVVGVVVIRSGASLSEVMRCLVSVGLGMYRTHPLACTCMYADVIILCDYVSMGYSNF